MATGIVGEYRTLQRETDADLLAMQVGDFYEFFAEDAETVGDELDLQLSEKASGGDSYAMAGVPVDQVTPHLRALVERGYRVAVADQGTDDTSRSIRRVVTPATLTEATDDDARYVAGVARSDDDRIGLAVADPTTGEFRVAPLDGGIDRLRDELARIDPVEVLAGPGIATAADDPFGACDARRVDRPDEDFAPGRAAHAVREQFGGAADTLDLDPDDPDTRAAGAVIAYVEATDAGTLAALSRLRRYRPDDGVTIDRTTRRHLEIEETMRGDRSGSLLATVDHTRTAGGGRRLRERLRRPIRDRETLDRRLDAVESLTRSALAREELRDVLDDAADLERLASRSTAGRADAGDLLAVRRTLGLLDPLRRAVDRADAPALDAILDRVNADRTADVADALSGLADDPPDGLRSGGLFEPGHDPDLDELIARHERVRDWIDEFAERERERLDIRHLQIDRNKTDGITIRVGNSETDAVPSAYREVKSLKSATRYTTDELDTKERELLRLEEARAEREYELFVDLRGRVAEAASVLQDAGRAIAELDVAAALATHAVANDWTRPTFAGGGVDGRSGRHGADADGAREAGRTAVGADAVGSGNGGGTVAIDAGRHPVVEQATEFVPNDARIGDDRDVLLVTGPNMSGKSTYMRGVALIVLLAQAGSFVPAERARIAPVDGIYTRVGAMDELAAGRSTFMVEMEELATILHSATDDSLVLLDEVGRGTATFDGVALAWAATEYLHNAVGASTLFATHYHELTLLAEHLDRVANVHVAVDDRGDDVTFLHAIRDGPADRSYGVHVAELAGVPEPVVGRARDVLDRLRAERPIEARGGDAGDEAAADDGPGTDGRQVIFDVGAGGYRGSATADGGAPEPLDPGTESVLEELRETAVDETAPIEMLDRVREWQERLGDR